MNITISGTITGITDEKEGSTRTGGQYKSARIYLLDEDEDTLVIEVANASLTKLGDVNQLIEDQVTVEIIGLLTSYEYNGKRYLKLSAKEVSL
jgi:hypothetical protein